MHGNKGKNKFSDFYSVSLLAIGCRLAIIKCIFGHISGVLFFTFPWEDFLWLGSKKVIKGKKKPCKPDLRCEESKPVLVATFMS